jgi:hypothetical protein
MNSLYIWAAIVVVLISWFAWAKKKFMPNVRSTLLRFMVWQFLVGAAFGVVSGSAKFALREPLSAKHRDPDWSLYYEVHLEKCVEDLLLKLQQNSPPLSKNLKQRCRDLAERMADHAFTAQEHKNGGTTR